MGCGVFIQKQTRQPEGDVRESICIDQQEKSLPSKIQDYGEKIKTNKDRRFQSKKIAKSVILQSTSEKVSTNFARRKSFNQQLVQDQVITITFASKNRFHPQASIVNRLENNRDSQSQQNQQSPIRSISVPTARHGSFQIGVSRKPVNTQGRRSRTYITKEKNTDYLYVDEISSSGGQRNKYAPEVKFDLRKFSHDYFDTQSNQQQPVSPAITRIVQLEHNSSNSNGVPSPLRSQATAQFIFDQQFDSMIMENSIGKSQASKHFIAKQPSQFSQHPNNNEPLNESSLDEKSDISEKIEEYQKQQKQLEKDKIDQNDFGNASFCDETKKQLENSQNRFENNAGARVGLSVVSEGQTENSMQLMNQLLYQNNSANPLPSNSSANPLPQYQQGHNSQNQSLKYPSRDELIVKNKSHSFVMSSENNFSNTNNHIPKSLISLHYNSSQSMNSFSLRKGNSFDLQIQNTNNKNYSNSNSMLLHMNEAPPTDAAELNQMRLQNKLAKEQESKVKNQEVEAAGAKNAFSAESKQKVLEENNQPSKIQRASKLQTYCQPFFIWNRISLEEIKSMQEEKKRLLRENPRLGLIQYFKQKQIVAQQHTVKRVSLKSAAKSNSNTLDHNQSSLLRFGGNLDEPYLSADSSMLNLSQQQNTQQRSSLLSIELQHNHFTKSNQLQTERKSSIWGDNNILSKNLLPPDIESSNNNNNNNNNNNEQNNKSRRASIINGMKMINQYVFIVKMQTGLGKLRVALDPSKKEKFVVLSMPIAELRPQEELKWKVARLMQLQHPNVQPLHEAIYNIKKLYLIYRQKSYIKFNSKDFWRALKGTGFSSSRLIEEEADCDQSNNLSMQQQNQGIQPKLSDELAGKFVRNILSAVSYLHSFQGRVHGQLDKFESYSYSTTTTELVVCFTNARSLKIPADESEPNILEDEQLTTDGTHNRKVEDFHKQQLHKDRLHLHDFLQQLITLKLVEQSAANSINAIANALTAQDFVGYAQIAAEQKAFLGITTVTEQNFLPVKQAPPILSQDLQTSMQPIKIEKRVQVTMEPKEGL